MDKEVDPQVLAVIDEKRLSGPRLTPVDIVARMGVPEAREKASEHAWLATGDMVIATIWAEFVSIGSGGRWFCLESLDPEKRIGGGDRTAFQAQRGRERLALLKRTFDAGTGFRAVLQTNRVAIAEIESSKSAKVSTRVRDDDEWHVASWDTAQLQAVLVRGARGWTPSADEVAQAAARGSVPKAAVASSAAANASADEVQAGALDHITRHFTGYGYRAENVTAQDLGYDLEITNAKGATLLRVVVKGTTAALPAVRLSATQAACAQREPLWRLLVVSDVGSPGMQHKIYKPTEMQSAPGFQAD